MEFQFADCLTHICAYLCSILNPGVTLVNALCIQLPLTSSFFYTCHLGLVSSFHHRVIFVPLSLSLSVCPSYYICNQEKHCLTLPYLTDPPSFLPSLFQSNNQCSVVCAAYLISHPLSALMPFPITPPAFTLSSLVILLFLLSQSATNQLTALSMPPTPPLLVLSLRLPQNLSWYLLLPEKWQSIGSVVNLFVFMLSLCLCSKPRRAYIPMRFKSHTYSHIVMQLNDDTY